MTQFFVEVFTPRSLAGEIAGAERRAARAAAGGVRFVRATYVPEDEICFFVFDAPSGRDAALVAERAGLEPLRVVEVVQSEREER